MDEVRASPGGRGSATRRIGAAVPAVHELRGGAEHKRAVGLHLEELQLERDALTKRWGGEDRARGWGVLPLYQQARSLVQDVQARSSHVNRISQSAGLIVPVGYLHAVCPG